ncbi:MAG: hypothetical protein HYU04_01120 [Candidatus Wildermuthbacteria bacterium]|nr:hypothetical protein [Candidatus Wildermuthbacteria bacterium]
METVCVVKTGDIPIFGPHSGIVLQGEPFHNAQLGHGTTELQRVTLPKAWMRRSSPFVDGRWKIIDSEGFERAIITTEERGEVLLWPLQRFQVRHHHVEGGYIGVVLDGGKEEVYTTDLILPPSSLGGSWPNGDPEGLAREWLNEHYPDWCTPGAYWD